MKYSRRIFVSICWVLLGAVLVGCSLAGLIEEFWNGMGTAFLVVGGLQIVKHIRYRTNETYREKVDTENQDERNRFIAGKAWAWAGYLFVLIAAAASIVFKLMGREELMLLASSGVSLMVLLYWLSYMILRKKY